MHNDRFIYSLKVWLLTCIIPPIIGLLVIGEGKLATLEWMGVFPATGMNFSLPALFLFMFISYWLYRLVRQAWKRKIILSFTGIAFVYFSFYLLDKAFVQSQFLQFLFVCYAVMLAVAVFIVGQPNGIQEKENNSVHISP